MVMGAAVHDFRIDQGRILAIRPNAIALLERDGSRRRFPSGRRRWSSQATMSARSVCSPRGRTC